MEALGSISPWWWVAGAVLLAAIEMLTVSTVLIWSALAAMTVAVCMWLLPNFSGAAQLATFAILSIAYTFAGRALVGRYGDAGETPSNINRRADQLIGRQAEVLSFEQHEGKVSVDGIPWPARLDGSKTPEVGEHVKVIAADGIVVWVRRIEPEGEPRTKADDSDLKDPG